MICGCATLYDYFLPHDWIAVNVAAQGRACSEMVKSSSLTSSFELEKPSSLGRSLNPNHRVIRVEITRKIVKSGWDDKWNVLKLKFNTRWGNYTIVERHSWSLPHMASTLRNTPLDLSEWDSYVGKCAIQSHRLFTSMSLWHVIQHIPTVDHKYIMDPFLCKIRPWRQSQLLLADLV